MVSRSTFFGFALVSVAGPFACAGDPAVVESTSTDDSSSGSTSPTSGPTTTSNTSTDPDSSGSTTTLDPDSSGTATTTTDPDTSGTTADPSDSSASSDSSGDETTTTGESSTTESPESSSTTDPDALPDITGDHLLALAIIVDPSLPLQYLATVVQTPDGDGALLDVSLQPLTLDQGSTTTPRLPLGNPLVINDVEVDADGTFTLVIGDLAVAAATNPITASDVSAQNIVLQGQLVDDDNWCGTMTGDLVVPIPLDLNGSTFGAVATDGMLPNVFPTEC